MLTNNYGIVNGSLHRTGRGETTFIFKVVNNTLLMEKDTPEGWEKRVYKIAAAKDHGTVYKVQKTQIKSSGGPEGLEKFFDREENSGIGFMWTFANQVWDTVKPAK